MKSMNILKSEILKLKRTPVLLLVIGAPIFLAIIYFCVYFFRAERLTSAGEGWTSYLSSSLSVASHLLIPLFVILLMSLLHNTEHKQKGYSLLGTKSPSRWIFLLNKAIVAQLLILTSLVIYVVLIFISALGLELKHPDLFTLNIKHIYTLVHFVVIVFVSSFGLCAFQFWGSLRWKNIVIPIGIGMAGFISFFILVNGWKHIYLHPFALPMLNVRTMIYDAGNYYINKVTFVSIISGFTFYLVSFIEFSKKNILG